MRFRKKIGWVMGGILAVSLSAIAGEPSVKITAVPKTEELKQQSANAVAMKELSGVYKVIVKNTSFMDPTPPLTVQYRVYVRRDDGMKQARNVKPQRFEGETTVDVIKPGASAAFETKAVKLRRTTLDGGYFYSNGRQSSTKDELVGIWVRLSTGGKMIAEYLSSSNLAKNGAF